MRLPKSFNDITIGQYQDVYFLLPAKEGEDDVELLTRWAQIIAILTGKDLQTISDLPTRQLKHLIKCLNFILRPEVLQEKPKQYIAVNGRICKAVLQANQLSTAQLIDIKSFLIPIEDLDQSETTVVNAHKLLASIYLPLSFKGFKYDSSKHSKLAEDFRQAKMGDVYGTLFFYSVLSENLIKSLEDFGKPHIQLIQNHMTEIHEWLQENSSTNAGTGKKPSTNSREATRSGRKSTTHGTA